MVHIGYITHGIGANFGHLVTVAMLAWAFTVGHAIVFGMALRRAGK